MLLAKPISTQLAHRIYQLLHMSERWASSKNDRGSGFRILAVILIPIDASLNLFRLRPNIDLHPGPKGRRSRENSQLLAVIITINIIITIIATIMKASFDCCDVANHTLKPSGSLEMLFGQEADVAFVPERLSQTPIPGV